MDNNLYTHKNKYHADVLGIVVNGGNIAPQTIDEMLRAYAQLSYNAGMRDAKRTIRFIDWWRNSFVPAIINAFH